MKPRLLDLFCGAGGASEGYHRVGFEVVGVDIKSQKHYPFEFHQADALEYPLEGFDAVHASPPCQAYSDTRWLHRESMKALPRLIEATRTRLDGVLPYVIENVNGAPLDSPVMLCGLMFHLDVLRHRYFESNIGLDVPEHPVHPKGNLTGAHRAHPGYRHKYPFVCVAGHNFDPERGRQAMGIPWMSRAELGQAIPPGYTEYIGRQLRKKIQARPLTLSKRTVDCIGKGGGI